jgi:hypothetical protein
MKRNAIVVAFGISIAAWIGGSTAVTLGAAAQADALARLREAIGGDAAINAVRSIRARSTIKRQPHKDHVEIKVELPDRYLRTVRSQGATELRGGNAHDYVVYYAGEMRQAGPLVPTSPGGPDPGQTTSGFNGLAVIPSWIIIPTERTPHLISQRLVGIQARFAEFVLPLLGRTSPAYVVDAKSEGNAILFRGSGARWWQLDLDPVTNLPRRMSWTTPVPPQGRAGATPSYWQVDFSDYRMVGGLRWPHRLIKSRNGQPDDDMTVEKYELNVSLKFPK